MMRLVVPTILLAAAALAPAAHAQQTSDAETVRALVVRSGEAFDARDPAAIIALYARDVVLSYPGIPDQDYATLEAGYREMTAPRPSVTVRTVPTIEEVLVSGDLAVVRVIWTTNDHGDRAGARGHAAAEGPAGVAAGERRKLEVRAGDAIPPDASGGRSVGSRHPRPDGRRPSCGDG